MSTSSVTLPPPAAATPAAPRRVSAAPDPASPGAIRPAQAQGREAVPAFTGLRHPRDAHRATLEFTGSGSEYFRIWIVNLLLTLVTLGLYRPWAKVRRLRYFYTNTHVAGHSLDFHGKPGQMLRGMLFFGVLLGLYTAASESSSPLAGGLALLAVLALWPLLLRASLQFRLGHTSWRGLRFGFEGTVAGAYKAVGLPLLLLLLVPAALGFFLAMGASFFAAWVPARVAAALLVPGSVLLVVPYFHWRLMQYRQGHCRLGGLQSELRLGAGRVYGLYLRALGLALLVPAGLGALAAVLAGGLASGLSGSGVAGWMLGLAVVCGIWLYVGVGAYFTVGLQNMVWSRTGNRYLRFRSELPLPPYLLLQLKNLLLLALTLGLYWPWAAVANRRMRLEAVSVVSRVDLEELTQALQPGGGLAMADAAGDLLGLDLGV